MGTITTEFELTNDPNQSFTIKVGDRRIKIEIFFGYVWAFNIFDADNNVYLSKGRVLLHGNDLFVYCNLAYKLWYLNQGGDPGVGNISPLRNTLADGILYLDAPI